MAQFTNQARLSYNGNTVNSNIVTGNLVEVLAVSKTAAGNSYTEGETVTYVIGLTNSGTTAFTGITVTDNLGAYAFGSGTVTPLDYVEGSLVYYQNGVEQAVPTVTGVEPLTVTGLSVPAGGNAVLVYKAKANAFAPLAAQSRITNTAAVSAATLGTNLTAEETISVLEEPILSITKCLSPVNVTENSELTYTFTLQNTGNTPAGAADNVVITDTFDPILSNISVTVNGVALPQANYTYDAATGVFSTAAGALTVPAAGITTDAEGRQVVTPGITTVTVTGTV